MPCTAAQRGSRGTTLLLHAMDAGGCVESELFPEESGGYILPASWYHILYEVYLRAVILAHTL